MFHQSNTHLRKENVPLYAKAEIWTICSGVKTYYAAVQSLKAISAYL